MSGLTPQGFEIKRLTEIRSDLETSLRQAFGEIDLRAESNFGQFVGISSEMNALLWQLAEAVYLSQYPDSATGVSLDHVAAITGVVRAPARPTQVTAIAYGQDNTTLSEGREAENARTGDVYRSTVAVRIDRANAIHAAIELASVASGNYTVTVRGADYTYAAGGSDTEQQILTGISGALAASGVGRTLETGRLVITDGTAMELEASSNIEFAELGVTINFNALETGPLILGAGDLTQIKTPVAGWDRLSNPDPGVTGSRRETDGELRARRERSIQITATNTLDAITSRLRQTQFVTDVNVVQNNGSTDDSFGTLRQHIWAIVEGGADEDIARVLFDATAAGIGYRGDETIGVASEVSGKTFQVSFDRPTYIDPAIVVEYVKLSGFPPEGEDLIRKALVAQTYTLGQRLVVPRLYTPVNTVDGVDIESITVNGAGANLTPDPNEKIRILSANVTVTEVV